MLSEYRPTVPKIEIQKYVHYYKNTLSSLQELKPNAVNKALIKHYKSIIKDLELLLNN